MHKSSRGAPSLSYPSLDMWSLPSRCGIIPLRFLLPMSLEYEANILLSSNFSNGVIFKRVIPLEGANILHHATICYCLLIRHWIQWRHSKSTSITLSFDPTSSILVRMTNVFLPATQSSGSTDIMLNKRSPSRTLNGNSQFGMPSG